MIARINRRATITLLSGAAAWPLAARAQQRAMPVVGLLHVSTPEESTANVAAFRKGLSETGFVEGRNVAIEFRFAHSNYARLPELAADLVRRRVAIIAASNLSAGLAAKTATATIPVIFHAGGDPVRAGLVASLNRPGGNVTGINSMNIDLVTKRLGLLHELLPGATRYAVIVNPNDPSVDSIITDTKTAAANIGKQIEILYAGTNREIDTAFTRLVQSRAEAISVEGNPLFLDRRVQVVTLATRHILPAIYGDRELTQAGGLMSYGPVITDAYRQLGIYAGRVLKGEKPADLPVIRQTKFEFVINLQTARTLGIEIPPTLLALADEVIE
jgi:putative ABC transport system substrate-binding protein